MCKIGDRICYVSESFFWYIKIIDIVKNGIICNIISFLNEKMSELSDNHFIDNKNGSISNYVFVTPELEKKMVKIVFARIV